MTSLEFSSKNNAAVIAVIGVWDKNSLSNFKQTLPKFTQKKVILDFSRLTNIDTAGICYFLSMESELKNQNYELERVGLNPTNSSLYALCEKNFISSKKTCKIKHRTNRFFITIGENTIKSLRSIKRFLRFAGLFFHALGKIIRKPSDFRFIAFLYHIEHSALNALPIIALTSLLVGVVLSYQAAYQLTQFGANIFIVDMVGIAALREIAPLIAAIVIAGRSASSYTAQIGVMKITEEVAAMNTMGFDSARFIIIPRVLALSFAMPLIVTFADAISVLGGMFVADLSLGINYAEFIRRFQESIALKHYLIGVIKAPMFGFIIGLIACFRGFGVKNTTESIGIYTTKSVVDAIFWVIAFDAIFSVFLTKAGL